MHRGNRMAWTTKIAVVAAVAAINKAVHVRKFKLQSERQNQRSNCSILFSYSRFGPYSFLIFSLFLRFLPVRLFPVVFLSRHGGSAFIARTYRGIYASSAPRAYARYEPGVCSKESLCCLQG